MNPLAPMAIFVLRRALQAVSTLVGVAVVVFAIFHFSGMDPAEQLLGKHASVARLAELRAALGLDRSLGAQFFDYLRSVATFDFGTSYLTHRRISSMVLDGIGPTLSLAIPAFFLTLFLSLGFAAVSTCSRARGYGRCWTDRLMLFLCVAEMSVPVLTFVVAGQYFLAFRLGWFPISGYESGWDRVSFLALPVMIWVVAGVGYQARFFRTAFLREITRDYVRTARAKGVSETGIFFKHVLTNSLVPVLTSALSQIPFLILGSFLLESYFGIPGLGGMTVEAFHSADFPVIQAMTTLVAMIYVVINLVIDLAYLAVDPRLGAQR